MRAVSEKRLTIEQQDHQHAVRRGWFWWARWENLSWLEPVLAGFLWACGLYDRGLRNVLDVRLTAQDVVLPKLPMEFDGFQVLWISDLHSDYIDGLTEKVLSLAERAEYDIAVLGGDFCFHHMMTPAAADCARLVAQKLVKKTPVYAVLGNHDYAPLADVLRQSGVTLLLNENTAICRNGHTLRLIGVDDCHYFKADDLSLATQGVNEKEVTILLSHSPELYAAAAEKGIDLMLSGHTHGGQICLPGGRAVVSSIDAPRKCIRGLWRHGSMVGFTSVGAGASGVAVRYHCRGEINLLTLRKNEALCINAG